MSGSYSIQEFAALAGVTVKALHHYDRAGLLKPGRSRAGYRLYREGDLERVKSIVALKRLGFPLRRIPALLTLEAPALAEALRSQKRILAAKRQTLGRAIEAIDEAAAPEILRRLAEVIEMQDRVSELRSYYRTEEAWEKHARYWREWLSAERRALYRDAVSAVNEDPAPAACEQLASRWLDLEWREAGGDPDLRWGMILAWANRDYWPESLGERAKGLAPPVTEDFLRRSCLALLRSRFTAEDLAVRAGLSREANREWFDLFVAMAREIGGDPGSEQSRALAEQWWQVAPNGGLGQTLIARWRELAASAQDPEIRLVLFAIERIWAFIAHASYRSWVESAG